MDGYRKAGLVTGLLFISAVFILLLVTLSREIPKSGPADLDQFLSLGRMLREGRTWATDVVAQPAWCIGAGLYYAAFLKMRLVPRWLSLWGLAGIPLTLGGSALVLFGLVPHLSTLQVLLFLPLALQELFPAVWLVLRGFTPPAATGA